MEVLPRRRAGRHGTGHFEGEFAASCVNFTAPVALYCTGYYALAQSQQRPLAPVLLAVGGIGGTALDQRQQYTACHTLKKVLAPLSHFVAKMSWSSLGTG